MYLYDFSSRPRHQFLGQGPLVSVVGGVQQVSSDGAKLLQTLFTNRYPQPTGAFSYSKDVAVPTAFDANADLLGYIASSTAPQAGGINQTVYDQIQSMPDKSLFLVDIPSAQAAIAGQPTDVVYAIAKNQGIASFAAGPSSSYARLLPVGGGAAPGVAPKAAPKSNAAPIVAGIGIAALIALIAASA